MVYQIECVAGYKYDPPRRIGIAYIFRPCDPDRCALLLDSSIIFKWINLIEVLIAMFLSSRSTWQVPGN